MLQEEHILFLIFGGDDVGGKYTPTPMHVCAPFGRARRFVKSAISGGKIRIRLRQQCKEPSSAFFGRENGEPLCNQRQEVSGPMPADLAIGVCPSVGTPSSTHHSFPPRRGWPCPGAFSSSQERRNSLEEQSRAAACVRATRLLASSCKHPNICPEGSTSTRPDHRSEERPEHSLASPRLISPCPALPCPEMACLRRRSGRLRMCVCPSDWL